MYLLNGVNDKIMTIKQPVGIEWSKSQIYYGYAI